MPLAVSVLAALHADTNYLCSWGKQKAYLLKNLNALVAIITGLKSEWVAKARQQAFSKIGTWEARMLRDLTDWTSSVGDFKHIRQTVDSLVEAKSSAQDGPVKSADGQTQTTRSRAASDSKPPQDPACIPFFGSWTVVLSSTVLHANRNLMLCRGVLCTGATVLQSAGPDRPHCAS